MKHFLTNFLRMGSTVSTPPIRSAMRSILLVLGLILSVSVWGEDVTLTETEIKTNFTSSAHSYGGGSASFDDGEVTWYLGDYSTTASSKWFQLKKDQGVYLKITTPENTKITSLTLTITSATNSKGGAQDITKHTAYSGRIALSTEDITGSTSMEGVGYTEAISDNSATILVSGTNRILYLKTSGAARIWGATVSYASSGDDPGSPEPTVSAEPNKVEFGTKNIYGGANTSGDIDVAVTGSNLTDNITATLSGDDANKFSLSCTSFVQSEGSVSGTLTVSYNVSEIGEYSANVTLSSTGADDVVLPISLKVINETPVEYRKVTSALTDWSGEYLLVYENSATEAYVWTGVDAANSYASAAISDGKITKPSDGVKLTIAPMTENYSILINGGVNDGKYVGRTSGSNGMDFNESAIQNVITYSNGVTIGSNTSTVAKLLYYSNDKKFRYYTSNQKAIQLYKKVVSSVVTIDDGIANGSVGVTGAADLSAVASGTELTLSNTPVDGYKLSAYDVYKTGESTTKETVTNGKFTMPDYDVTVSASFEAAKVLTDIEITTQANQKTFWVGETFNYDGLVVTAHFEGADDEEVTPTSISEPAMNVAGKKTITVSYTEGTTTKTANYIIDVKALPTTQETAGTVADLIDIYDKLGNTSDVYVRGTIYNLQTFYTSVADAGKYTYWITDEYNSENNPNHTNEFEIFKGTDFNGAVFASADDLEEGQEVVVKGDLTKWSSTYEFNATGVIVSRPKVLKSIALSGSLPTEFTQGDEFSSEGLVVTATYNYGEDATVSPTAITGYDMSATGDQTVTVSYTESGVTKTATYNISVAAPDNCEHKATISKGAEENGTFELSVSGELCLDALDGNKTSTVLTASPATHYHLAEVTATVGTVGTINDNICTISEINASTTITAVFAEDDKAILTFAKGDADGEEAAPANIEDYAGEVTLPACPFTYTGHYFIGWKKGDTEEIYQPGAYTITAADVTAGTIAFTAQWAEGYIFEWVAGDHGYTDGQEIGLVNSEPVAIEFAEGSKYYVSDKTARFYNTKSLTITAPTDYVISKIEFTTTGWGATANKGTLDGNTWTGLAKEVIFTANATSKVKSLKVYYKEGVASTLEIDDIELEYEEVVDISPKTVTPVEAASHVGYEIKTGSDDCITLEGNQITAKSVTGTATIVATIPDASEYLGTSVEFTVRVSAPDNRKKAYSPNAGFDAISGILNADIAYAAYDGGGTSAAKINGTAIQLYQPSSTAEYGGFVTVTAVKGCTIDQVKITTATNATKISYSKDGGDLSEPQADNIPAGNDYLTPAELNAQSVNLYCMGGSSSNRLYIAAMTVYYTGEPLADPEIAYEPEEQTIVVGDSWSAPVLKNENGVTITSYSSDNEEVATVTNEGVISLVEDALGTATITAHFDGDENFKAADATYTITIISAGDAHLATSVWTLVEDASKLKAGMEIIIANADGTTTMAPYTTGNNCKEVSGASLDGKIITPQAGTAIVTLEATGTANQFALKVAEQYLYAASSSSNYLKGRDANEDGNSEWTISITDGKAEVIAQGNNTRNVMRYNSSSKLFSCYSSSADQSDIAFYTRAKEERAEFTVGKLATVCVPYAVAQEDIIGADVFEVAGKNEVGKIVFDQVVAGGMEAGVAYLVQAKAETATFYYSGDPVSEPKNEGKALKGTFTEKQFATGEADNIYFFKDNALWAAKETGVKILANRAWLDMSAVGNAGPSPAPGRRRIVLGVHGEQVATGVESIQPSENGVQKVLINGELFILRGEKMYNVNGQLVK